ADDRLSFDKKSKNDDNISPTKGAPSGVTLTQLFNNQQLKTPDHVAIRAGKTSLTYRQTAGRSDQIAWFLTQKGVGPGSFVGLFLERTADLIPAILGILKTGAAYVPLDTLNPPERLRLILDDVRAGVILTHSTLKDRLPGGDRTLVFADQIRGDIPANFTPHNPAPDDYAYVIYTSGSTGRPKGVAIIHHQISTHLVHMRSLLDVGENSTFFSVISASFDPSVQDFFLPLISGGKLILADENTCKDGFELAARLRDSDADRMVATPATWRMLLTAGWSGKPGLRLISTGEALSKKLARQLLDKGQALYNFYGPTETVIYATAKKVSADDLEKDLPGAWVSIGQPLPDTYIYILDNNRQPLPPGTPGEIYIGGFRVAKGYFQRPEKTAEVFLEDPFRPGERIYKTGDLGIMGDDGNIFYINRMDNQVKLRGHRIELGEIEAQIREMPGVGEAVVLLREDRPDHPELVAYVLPNADNNLIINDLKDLLSRKLPAYMVPARWVEMREFPLTSAGKINRRVLPAPTVKTCPGTTEKSLSDTEKILSGFWEELLGVPEAGPQDNFYDLGGHSLLAVGILAKIEDHFGVRLPLVTFIESPTIENLARAIDQRLGKSEAVPPAPELNGHSAAGSADFRIIPMTEGQKEIWVSHHLHDETAKSYNIGSELRLRGAVKREHLTRAILELVARHEALRTSIEPDGQHQKVWDSVHLDIPFFDWSDLPENERENRLAERRQSEIERVFDLEKAPLANFLVVQTQADEMVVLLTMHHILLDGWSRGVLLNDLGLLFQKQTGEKTGDLPPATQLTDFVNHWESWRQSPDYQADEAFWLEQFKGGIPKLNFPTDRPVGQPESFAADEAALFFPAPKIESLRAKARENNLTFYAFMLAAFEAFIGRLTRQNDFILGISVSGKSIVRFQDLVAHRTNLLPLRVSVNPETGFETFLHQSYRDLLTAFDHQDYTLGTLVQKLNIPRDTGRHPLVNVVFNMETMSRTYDFGKVAAEAEFIPGNFKTPDLIVHLRPAPAGYEMKWIYKKEIFESSEVSRRLAEFEAFLDQIVAHPDQPLSAISLIPDPEWAQIRAFGAGEPMFVEPKCLHELFESQVLQTPYKTAIQFGDEKLSYFDFNKKANRLANFLIQKGLKTNDFVGICLEPSPEILIAIYAILKAGGTYVPLDPLNPPKRLESIWSDAQCGMMVSRSKHAGLLANFGGTPIYLDQTDAEIQAQSPINPRIAVSTDQPAYVIYTSGSTGTPKGVGIPHGAALNTLRGLQTHLETGPKAVFFSVSSMAFDMSIPDYFLSLMTGATLVLADSETKKDGFALKNALEKYRPTLMQATPTTWRILLLAGWEGLPGLQIVAGGEGLSRDLAESLLSKGRRVFNGYGPTEAAIYSTFKEVTWGNISAVPAAG
ncbi:MAG: amino acid adenylation domain-containing protein, partial [Bacteroidetes bacterium]